jgi:hypothetical protein
MSSLVVNEGQPIPASILTGGQLPVLSHPAYPLSLRIDLPDLGFCVLSSVTPHIESGRMVFECRVDEDASLVLRFTGVPLIEQLFLNARFERDSARAAFVSSTFLAALNLAGEVHLQIPEMQVDIRLKLNLSLLEISELLQSRQTAYRLMIIERATGKKFEFPAGFSRSDIEDIAFVYRAIVDRSFVWHLPSLGEFCLPALPESLTEISGISDRHETPPAPFTKNVIGESIHLGNHTVAIEDFFIQDADRVKNELEKGDGHPVKFLAGSRSYQATFHFPEAPRLPDLTWDSNIQTLIDLESKLDDRLCELYNALAASTLEGLTDEQKAAVTARPELDWGSFLTNDTDEEEG